ncbi:hypothetical protein [Flavobacterium solisilvae]|nr:hypothetical protein [Flavobacterium solisilvae]
MSFRRNLIQIRIVQSVKETKNSPVYQLFRSFGTDGSGNPH